MVKQPTMPDQLGRNVLRLMVNLRMLRPPQLAQRALSTREMILLFLLNFYEVCTVKFLAARLEVPLNTASTYIRRLAARGFVVRSLYPVDARIHIIRLTDGGREYLKGIETDHGKSYGEVIRSLGFTPSELTALGKVVDRANSAIEKMFPHHSPAKRGVRQTKTIR